MKLLVIQETDWIKRGPHNSHHLMERLSEKGHEIRVIDYEILWNNSKNNSKDCSKGLHSLISERKTFYNCHKATNNGNITVIRPSIVKFPVLNYISLIYTHKKEIEKQINEFKPDLIINVGNLLNGYIAQKLAKKSGIPVLYFIMDVIHRLVPETSFQPLAYYIERKNMKNSKWVVSINKGLKEYTVSMGAREKNTMVFRTGVDLSFFEDTFEGKKIREKYGIKDDEIVLFFMGWLYTFSGLKELALEIARNRERYPKVKLLILGNGDLWDDLQKIIQKYDLEQKIIMVGWQPYEDVPKYLSAADICLLLSHNNKIMKYIVPIKIYEYMAAGKPIIAMKLYGLLKEFGSDSGILYIDESTNNVKDILYLIENVNLKKEGDKARKFVEKNDWNQITVDFEFFLTSYISSCKI